MSEELRPSIAELVENLRLQPHPEGGYYRETWRSSRQLDLPDYQGPRSAGTSILFLLPKGQISRWHRVASDELWFWQGGDPIELTLAKELKGSTPEQPQTMVLGDGLEFQAVVPAHHWQMAEPAEGHHGYCLCACIVVPGFDFQDFEMA